MANNPVLFDAAFSAAVAGIEAGRIIRDTALSGYQSVRDAANTFATTLDALIPASLLLGPQDGELMNGICSNILAGRFLLSTTDTLALCQSIAALWNECRPLLVNTAPALVERLAWNGLLNFTQTVLAAPHAPGLYQVTGIIDVTTAAAGGIVDRVTSWTNQNGAAESASLSLPPNVSIPGVAPQAEAHTMAVSNGLGPITIEWQPGGVAPGAVIDVFSVATYLGKRA